MDGGPGKGKPMDHHDHDKHHGEVLVLTEPDGRGTGLAQTRGLHRL